MKKTIIFTILVLFILLFSGCGKKTDDGDNETEETPEDTTPEETPDDIVEAGPDDTADDTSDDTSDDTAAPDDTSDDTSDDTADDDTTPQLPDTEVQPADAEDVIIIQIKNFRFLPKELTIRPGMTVVWKNAEDPESKHYYKVRPRKKYEQTPGWDSPLLYVGDTYNYTFMEKGEFDYVDAVFLKSKGTEGKIIVK